MTTRDFDSLLERARAELAAAEGELHLATLRRDNAAVAVQTWEARGRAGQLPPDLQRALLAAPSQRSAEQDALLVGAGLGRRGRRLFGLGVRLTREGREMRHYLVREGDATQPGPEDQPEGGPDGLS